MAVFPREYAAYVQKRTGRQASSSSSTYLTYRVQRGDSLWEIARRHNTSVSRIRNINALNGSRIVAGQTIRVPRS